MTSVDLNIHALPIYTDEIRAAKLERSTAENEWRVNRIQINFNKYKHYRNTVSVMVETAKMCFYHKLTTDTSGDPKGLHQVMSPLFHSKYDLHLPPHDDPECLLISSPSTNCEIDSVPTWLLKLCGDEILPLLTKNNKCTNVLQMLCLTNLK